MLIKELRIERKLKSKEVADAIGCTAVTYGRYESGERTLPPDIIIRLAEFYGVTSDYILGISDASPERLSDYERELIDAARSADKRSREDALLLLSSHPK